MTRIFAAIGVVAVVWCGWSWFGHRNPVAYLLAVMVVCLLGLIGALLEAFGGAWTRP